MEVAQTNDISHLIAPSNVREDYVIISGMPTKAQLDYVLKKQKVLITFIFSSSPLTSKNILRRISAYSKLSRRHKEIMIRTCIYVFNTDDRSRKDQIIENQYRRLEELSSPDWNFDWKRPAGFNTGMMGGVSTGSNKEFFGSVLALEFSVSDDMENTLQFHVAFPLIFNVYLTFDFRPWRIIKWYCQNRYGHPREHGFYFDREYFSFFWWKDSFGYTDKKGWSYLQEWERVLKGKSTVTDRELFHSYHDVTVPAYGEYPEATYRVKIGKKEYVTRYSRWPKWTWHRWYSECEKGVPHPGKGTADYNCDESAFYGTHHACDADIHNEEDVLKAFVEQAIWYRKNYPL